MLSLLVAVLRADGSVLFANAALEQHLGMSRRTLEGADFHPVFTDPALLQTALAGASGNDFAALRYEASLKRLHQDPVPVHVSVASTDVRARSWWSCGPWNSRYARTVKNGCWSRRRRTKELIPQSGARNQESAGRYPGGGAVAGAGAAKPELAEYTQVIVHEADRFAKPGGSPAGAAPPSAPGGRRHIHEVCSACAPHSGGVPAGLRVQRDY